jgi:hypothetical protein
MTRRIRIGAPQTFTMGKQRLADDAFSDVLESEMRERFCNSCGVVCDSPAELALIKTDPTGRPTRICKQCLKAKENAGQ